MSSVSRITAFAAILLFFLQIPVLSHDFADLPSVQEADGDALFSKLEEYLSALDRLDEASARMEVDFIIGSVQDEDLRSRVGEMCYRHFRDSKVMGSENLAVYVYDRYFADCTLLFENIDDFEDAKLYAYVNRASLIGADARELTLVNQKGKDVSLPGKRRAAIIFFYSATCPKCLYTATQMRDYFAREGVYAGVAHKRLKINVYNVYVGDDDLEWEEYCERHLKFVKRCGLKVYNLKGGDSDYVTAYGVVQTPRLFLISKKGKIIGRNLDVPALKILIEQGL